jgi:hypothetical protein
MLVSYGTKHKKEANFSSEMQQSIEKAPLEKQKVISEVR